MAGFQQNPLPNLHLQKVEDKRLLKSRVGFPWLTSQVFAGDRAPESCVEAENPGRKVA